jgi:membrane protease YdiL (CAAX protease family)
MLSQAQGCKRSGLGAYFVLTYAISWLAWGAMVIFQLPGGSVDPTRPAPPLGGLLLIALGGFAPSIAGVFMTWRTGGRAGLRGLWRRCTQFKLGRWPYLVIFLVPLLLSGARIAVQLLRGRALVLPAPLAQPLLLVGFTVQIFLFGPLSEELGWRGFALDRLLARWGSLRASLVLGIIHGLWHLPLFFVPGTIQQLWGDPLTNWGLFALGTIGGAIVFTWLHQASGGSVWAAILYHMTSNYAVSLVWMSFDGGIVDRLVVALASIGLAAGLAGISRARDLFSPPVANSSKVVVKPPSGPGHR